VQPSADFPADGKAYTGDGPALTSSFLDGLGVTAAKAAMIDWLEAECGARQYADMLVAFTPPVAERPERTTIGAMSLPDKYLEAFEPKYPFRGPRSCLARGVGVAEPDGSTSKRARMGVPDSGV